MTYGRVTFLMCDQETGCDAEFTGGPHAVKVVRAAARTDGWTWSPQRGDRCPEHAKRTATGGAS